MESSTTSIWGKERESEEETRGEGEIGGGRTVIDYANDQLGEWSFDSSSVVNAIAVWQFAAMQVHLTRFKSRSRGAKEKKKDTSGNRSAGASSSYAVWPVFNGFPRMEREYQQELAFPSCHQWMLDIVKLTTELFGDECSKNLRWILSQWKIIIEIVVERKIIFKLK